MPALNSFPFEVLGMPAEIYLADVGAVFPTIEATPNPAVWTRLGTEGNLNYTQDGVKASHPQSVNVWRSLGDPGPRKVFRTEEDLKFTVEVADLTLEAYKEAMNGNTVNTVASAPDTPAHKTLGLSRGLNIATRALLVRVPNGSPYMANGNAQYEIPLVQEVGSSEPQYRRDNPAILSFEWMALVDPDASSDQERFGRFVGQTEVAGS